MWPTSSRSLDRDITVVLIETTCTCAWPGDFVTFMVEGRIL